MMYFAFDIGEWANKFALALSERANAGVNVRLMVDEFGLVLDEPKHAIRNHQMLDDLAQSGVEVDIFRPEGHRLTRSNRLHLKVCAIDESRAFIGGSNIADHYLGVV